MPHGHRWLRWCLRALLPIFALGGFGSIASLFLISFAREQEVAHLDSPSHAYRAYVVRVEGAGGCGRDRSMVVRVQRHYSALRTGQDEPFCLRGEGSIHLKWLDSKSLEIQCQGCMDYDVTRNDWEGLHYSFDPDRP